MKSTALLLSTTLTMFVAPRLAAAQSASAPTALPPVALGAPAPAPALYGDRGALRLRIGIGGYGGLSAAGYAALGAGLGPSADLGFQIGDHLAVYAHGTVASILLLNAFSTDAIAEWTPLDWLSLGTGLGGMFIYTLMFEGGATAWGGMEVPLLVGFNIGGRGRNGVSRHVFRVGLESAVGVLSSSGDVGFRAGITLGYEVM